MPAKMIDLKFKRKRGRKKGEGNWRGLTKIGIPKVIIEEVVISDPIELAKKLKEIRIQIGFTGSAVAREIGWSPSNIHHFENATGTAGAGINTSLKYAKALGIKRIIFET